jgi:predicted HTH transcriptional regulator
VDGFELKLRNLMKSRFTLVPYSQVKTSYPIIDGKTVCRIEVTPDSDIYHLDNEVYVRHGASTEKLSGVALTNWIKNRTQM